jgi:hypothetical protein
MFMERDYLKNVLLKSVDKLTMFNKDRHMAKSTTFKKFQQGKIY